MFAGTDKVQSRVVTKPGLWRNTFTHSMGSDGLRTIDKFVACNVHLSSLLVLNSP